MNDLLIILIVLIGWFIYHLFIKNCPKIRQTNTKYLGSLNIPNESRNDLDESAFIFLSDDFRDFFNDK